MAITFQSDTLNQLYNGTAPGSQATSTQLSTFRVGGTDELDGDIEDLDERIASFESVLLPRQGDVGKTSSEYPYDKDGLRREFLNEVLALLLERSVSKDKQSFTKPVDDPINYAATNVLISSRTEVLVADLANPGTQKVSDLAKGTEEIVLNKTALTGSGNFANLSYTEQLALLNDAGKAIFKSYTALIDAVFAEGENLGKNPAQPVQVVSAIQPLTIDGVTYNRIAQVNDVPPTTYLLEATAEASHVVKDTRGNAILTGPATSTAKRLNLNPNPTSFDPNTDEYQTVLENPDRLDGLTFIVTSTKDSITVRESTSATPDAVQSISPLLLNVPGKEADFPDVRIVAAYRVTASNGSSYLVGISNETPKGSVYVTSLAPTHGNAVSTTASLSGLEYLLYYNEARVKILRAQLSYREAVVREIQDDLKKANDALADLEVQSGSITSQDTDGAQTGQVSADTMKMDLFNATASTANEPILEAGSLFLPFGTAQTQSSWHDGKGWQGNRTNLKNYIDRRSAEAQQATLDYQNVLNRFNNALEVMAKLQEKLDTLLKSQLRNLA